jgi:hypothetical protein
MARQLIDILLNIVAPLLCLLEAGIYVYKSGKILRGTLRAWGLLVLYEVVSLALGGIFIHFSDSYANLFDQGTGIFAMLFFGWVPGITVCTIFKLIRLGVDALR